MKLYHGLFLVATVASVALFGELCRRKTESELTKMRRELNTLSSAVENREVDREVAPTIVPEVVMLQSPAASSPSAPPVGASTADAPPQDRAAAQAAAHQEKLLRMEGSFADDSNDPSWTAKLNGDVLTKLNSALPEGSSLRTMECRSRMCRIETSHTSIEHYQAFLQKAFWDPSTKLWNAHMISLALQGEASADGSLTIVSYLAREGADLPSLNE